MINKKEMEGILNNATEITLSPAIENEDSLSLISIDIPQKQLTTRQKSNDIARKQSLLQREDLLISQREGYRHGPPQEYLLSLSSTPPRHIVDVTLGKDNYLPLNLTREHSMITSGKVK